MKFPKLKHPKLCRILSYVVVLGAFLLPIVLTAILPLPDIIKVPVILGLLLGCAVYIFKNFMVLMVMDMGLASLSCYQTARKLYRLPARRTANAIRRSVLRYGKGDEPAPNQPQPSALRYKHSNSMTVYAKGIERVVAAYEVDYLDNELYRLIFSSATANSNALSGKKKFFATDPSQRNAPVNRVTVILILAHEVDPQLTPNLYDLVCKRCGDEEANCIIPCVVDLAQNTCVFNCLRMPYVGFEYAVKNRGIRIVKKLVFGGNLNLKESAHHALKWDKEYSPENTLWDLWNSLYQEFYGATKATQRQFEAMEEKEILVKKDELYLKWDHRGVCLSIRPNDDSKTVNVEPVTDWYYPKMRPIAKTVISQIEDKIVSHYRQQGYRVEFTDPFGDTVFTCSHVLEENMPILHVTHDANEDWQFLCGQDHHATEDRQLVSIFDILEIDPGIENVMDLKPGQSANRKSVDDDWVIQ